MNKVKVSVEAILKLKRETLWGPGCAQDPARGAYSALTDALTDGERLAATPENPTPLSRSYGLWDL